jgi:hypothetical protein
MQIQLDCVNINCEIYLFITSARRSNLLSEKPKSFLKLGPVAGNSARSSGGIHDSISRTASKKTLSIKPTIFNIISNFGVIKSQRRSQFPRVCAGMIQYLITHKP